MKNIYLYIKTHNKTGLKYFGKKTAKNEEEVYNYRGSGKYWKRHLKKHGECFSTSIIRVFSYAEVEKCKIFALRFSEENNIVKSEEWANLMLEDGMTGWPLGENNPTHFLTEEQNKKKGNAFRGKERPNHSKKMLGENNPMYGKNAHTKNMAERAKNLKGKTYEEIFGQEKAKEIKTKISINVKSKPKNFKEIMCPHCCLSGKGPNLTRYHFDNCPLSEKNTDNIIGKFSKYPRKDKRKLEFKCTECGMVGHNIGNMNRWHFDNCKRKKLKGI